MSAVTKQFQVFPGVDDFSILLFALKDDGSIVEYGRTSTGQWTPVQTVKSAD